MAGEQPGRKFRPVPLGGVWNEARSPVVVGETGLTACVNLTYRRFGSWSKRAGSKLAYVSPVATPAPFPTAPTAGVRWYRAFPTPLTQTVVVSQGSIWTGGDPRTVVPQAPLTSIATLNTVGAAAPFFAQMRDPAINNGSGGDILIICGAGSTTNGFASGTLTLSGTPAAAQTVTATLINGGTTITTTAYTVLASDNLASIAAALAKSINASAAVTPGTPFIGQAVASGAVVSIYALNSGAAANAVTIQGTVTGAGVTIAPTVATALAGGGNVTSAPLKYDGSAVSGLSGQISRPFTGCVYWHDHMWFWGDPSAPDTLFASDIKQPEGFTFMTQNGGYDIGVGDGDPLIQNCIPIGNSLYVFKRNSIYVITGYDFQSGEYQFQVQPAVQGTGIPSPLCVTALNDALVFWTGSEFNRLAFGSFEPEYIGAPIPQTSAKVAMGNQSLMRCVAGNFAVSTLLNDSYGVSGPVVTQEIYNNIAIWAVDTGRGIADTWLVYDDDMTNFRQEHAWSQWTGLPAGGFIPFGSGNNSAQSGSDTPTLFWVPPTIGGQFGINQFGADTNTDNGAGIAFTAQTGWITCDTPALPKELHRIFLQVESNTSATITLSVLTAGYPPKPSEFDIPINSTANTELYEVVIAKINPFLKGNAFLLKFTENGNKANFELTGAVLDYVEEAFRP